MKPLRILYLDRPFQAGAGGDKNRSRFLWQALADTGELQAVSIERNGASSTAGGNGSAGPALQVQALKGPWWESESVPIFDAGAVRAFDALLSGQRFDAVFARFHTPWNLCRRASNHPSRPAVIMDLDMVSSRLVALSWQQRRTLKNRWFFFERWKLEWLERRLLRQPWLVFLSNPVELAQLRQRQAPGGAGAQLAELPNIMPAGNAVTSPARAPVILFFGSLDSAANLDGFRFLMDELVPRLREDLERHDARIHIAGKHPPAWFAERLHQAKTDRVVLLGAVDSMERTIAESRLVLLPLRVASGTRTRILEAAAQGRAVVTTSIGAEGIDVGTCARVHDAPDALVDAVRSLLANPAEADALGESLRQRCSARYAPSRVAGDLRRDLRAFVDQHHGGSAPA